MVVANYANVCKANPSLNVKAPLDAVVLPRPAANPLQFRDDGDLTARYR